MNSESTPLFKSTITTNTPYLDDDEVDSSFPYTGTEIYRPNNENGEDIMPKLHRSKTFSENVFNPDVNVPVSVNNPTNLSRRLSVFVGNDFNELSKRVDSLKLMRPFRLIGPVTRLIDWKKYKLSDTSIKNLKSKSLKRFYNEQNDMIDRYEDIDLLLDTGVQIEMIQNYEDNTSTDSSSEDDVNNSNSILENFNSNTSKTNTLTVPASKKVKKQNKVQSVNTESINKIKRSTHLTTVPGNIDLEGAKILGTPDESSSSIVTYAIYFNFLLNVVLLIGKFVVIYLSDSLSLIASFIDSALDFLSTLIIFIANKYAAKKSSKFPVGRKQLEPIGVLIFSVIIILSFSQVLIESLKELFNDANKKEIVTLNKTTILIMVTTITTKFVGYELCKSINNSSIKALVEDAKTDIVFNLFSLIFPAIGVCFQIWWIDAFGASLLCCYVIIQWWLITFEHINHLSGSNASKEDYQQVLYMVVRFTDEIAKVKNYRIYHMGDQVNVEVDIVLKNPKMSLKDCHDLGESLQYSIETLPYVNRCFVHIDYKVRNYLGHLSG